MDREKVIEGLQKIIDDDWIWKHADYYASLISDAIVLLKEQPEIVRCKDCEYYKIEECWEDMGHGVKMKAGRYEAICTKWANGTDSDGYCFRAELLD